MLTLRRFICCGQPGNVFMYSSSRRSTWMLRWWSWTEASILSAISVQLTLSTRRFGIALPMTMDAVKWPAFPMLVKLHLCQPIDCHIMNPNGTAHLTVAVPLLHRHFSFALHHGPAAIGHTYQCLWHSRSEIGRPQGSASPQISCRYGDWEKLLGLVMLMVVKFFKPSIDKQACPDNPCSTWNSN